MSSSPCLPVVAAQSVPASAQPHKTTAHGTENEAAHSHDTVLAAEDLF
jgi:hypothetical protein